MTPKAKLQRRARQYCRSTEEEVREILRNAVRGMDKPPTRLGSRIAGGQAAGTAPSVYAV